MVATWNIAADAAYYPREAEGNRRGSYYQSGKEPPGQWYAPKGDFGLVDSSPVDPAQFQRLYDGVDADGRPLIDSTRGRRADRVPAYDICFSAPRSVSLIWAFAPDDLRKAIEAAHDRATRAALDVLEREGTFARRGHNGVRVEPVALSAAIFRHGESRPTQHADGRVFGDMNLHNHSVVIACSTRADGTVGALASIPQRSLKKCLGAVMHSALAHELELLGFKIDRVGPNGVFEIKGISDADIEYYSQRRNDIEGELKKRGVTSKKAVALAAAVAKATRSSKSEALSSRRDEAWAEAAHARGIDVANFSESMRCPDRARDAEAGETLLAERLAALPEVLTTNQSVIDRKDLLREVASALVGTGLPSSRIDIEVQRLLDTEKFVEIGQDQFDRPRYTTFEILQLERNVVDCVISLSTKYGFALDGSELRARCERAGLSDEQAAAALAMASGSAIALVCGAPGSGKTTTLLQVAIAYGRAQTDRQGAAPPAAAVTRRVRGAASAWRTAQALGSDLSIPSRAVASWFEIARRGGDFLKAGDVLIVDEAGLINAKDMQALLSHVERAGAKAILVGDPKQLQAIGINSLGLVQRGIESARVDTIIRQYAQWQRDAIRAFGNGRADVALRAFADRGLLLEAEGEKATIDAVVAQWTAARTADPAREPLLLARTNADVGAISRAVREVLRAEGRILGPDVAFATATPSGQRTSIALARGDKVRFLGRNDTLGVINGTIATIIDVGRQPASLINAERIRVAAEVAGRRIEFAPENIADSKGRARLGWAYATTIYQAQGITVDRAVVLVDGGFDRHQIYVAASRSRNETILVANGKAIDQHIAADLPFDQQDASGSRSSDERLAWLATRLSQARVKEAALDVIDFSRERNSKGLKSPTKETDAKRTCRRTREASLG